MVKVGVKVTKDGKVILKVGNKNHATGITVTPETSKADIASKLGSEITKLRLKGAITNDEATELKNKKDTLATQAYNQAQKKKGKAEAPPKEKKEKEKEEKKIKPVKKEEKAKEKEEKKAKEVVPKKPTITLPITKDVILNALDTAKGKNDKKIQERLQKLADSYAYINDYVKGNSTYVTAEIFNALFALNDFKNYLNSPDAMKEISGIMDLLEYAYGKNGLSKDAPEDVLKLGDSAIGAYLSFLADKDKKFSKEAEALGGIKGTMDGTLFIQSLLCIRRMNKPGAGVLKLELVTEKPAVEKKVKYKLK